MIYFIGQRLKSAWGWATVLDVEEKGKSDDLALTVRFDYGEEIVAYASHFEVA